MKPNVRAAVAAMAIGHNKGIDVSSVYDYRLSRFVKVSVSVSGDKLDGYDYEERCHFGGTLPNAYHYGTRSHIELRSKGDGKYSGYDYDQKKHFEVTVRGSNADVYDYAESSHFSYSA